MLPPLRINELEPYRPAFKTQEEYDEAMSSYEKRMRERRNLNEWHLAFIISICVCTFGFILWLFFAFWGLIGISIIVGAVIIVTAMAAAIKRIM